MPGGLHARLFHARLVDVVVNVKTLDRCHVTGTGNSSVQTGRLYVLWTYRVSGNDGGVEGGVRVVVDPRDSTEYVRGEEVIVKGHSVTLQLSADTQTHRHTHHTADNTHSTTTLTINRHY